MARKQIIQMIDDLDGEEIADGGQTIMFALKGVEYEIDLSEKNVDKLTDALAPYVTAARKVGGRRQSAGSKGRAGKSQLPAMRAWAKEHGMKVSERGRVSQEVQNAYHAAV